MLNLNTKEMNYTIKMPVNSEYRIISFKNIIHKELVIMTGISELEYKKLENLNDLFINRGEYRFHIEPDDVLCYGEIDFHEGSDDSKELDTFNWLDHLYVKGVSVPSNYNYDKHQCVSPFKFCLWTETFKNSVICRYIHGCLGKPKYTLIFREVI